jgi:hypothetical protein
MFATNVKRGLSASSQRRMASLNARSAAAIIPPFNFQLSRRAPATEAPPMRQQANQHALLHPVAALRIPAAAINPTDLHFLKKTKTVTSAGFCTGFFCPGLFVTEATAVSLNCF